MRKPPSTASILVVDRDPEMNREIRTFLEGHGYGVEWAEDAEKAYNRLDAKLFDVLITEWSISRGDGMRIMLIAKERNPDICVVFLIKRNEIEPATEAMRQGAYDFQVKPPNLPKLEAVIQRGLAYQRLALEQVELKRRLDERFGLGNLIGQSRQMAQVYSAVRQIGATEVPVLIYGEPGTGKDLIAQALHNNSPRREEPFVKFDCAHMPESVAERELFGHSAHERPARLHQGRGRIELADKGTMFIDHIDELSAGLQAQIAFLLEKRLIRRPEDGKKIPVDVRLIAATNQRLETLIGAGAFRADLGRQLMAVSIEAPALRARREDIALLAYHALRQSTEPFGKREVEITANAMNVLIRYDWPGNVRELRNVIEGMVANARSGNSLGVSDIPEYLRRDATPETGELRIPTGATMKEIERIAIEETLKACAYNKELCAKTLGIGLRTLYRKLAEYGVR